MEERFSRTQMLIGDDALAMLGAARVAVFGIGGVGSYAVEALARAGVGELDLIDGDIVALSNINRQLIALDSTLGKPKAEVAKERVRDINPNIKVNARAIFFDAETANSFDFSQYDYVLDAIDSVSNKILLIECAKSANAPIISCMGMGNKLDPSAIEVADISKTSVCPLARVVRQQLKKRGISHLKTVFSKEIPINVCSNADDKKRVPGSVSFVPSVAGLIMASEAIKDIIACFKPDAI